MEVLVGLGERGHLCLDGRGEARRILSVQRKRGDERSSHNEEAHGGHRFHFLPAYHGDVAEKRIGSAGPAVSAGRGNIGAARRKALLPSHMEAVYAAFLLFCHRSEQVGEKTDVWQGTLALMVLRTLQ